MMFSLRAYRARRPRRSRGQVIVIGALTVFLLAVSLMMTFAVSWTVRERIRVQNAADANAYSSAVEVARAYNYFSYTNRAIAGAVVAQTMLSAYHSEIAAAADLYWGAALMNFEAAGIEFAEGCCCWCVYFCCPCCCPEHCVHAVEDGIMAAQFIARAGEMADDIQEVDPPFRQAVEAYQTMITRLTQSQSGMRLYVAGELALGGKKLEDINIPGGSAGWVPLGAINAMHFNSAIDTDTNSNNKHRDMTEVINASRPTWTRERGDFDNIPSMGFTLIVMEPLGEKIRDFQNNGGWLQVLQPPLGIGGSAGLVPGTSTGMFWPGPPNPNTRGNTVGSHDWWSFVGLCQHNHAGGGGVMPLIGPILPGEVYSRQSGDKHKGGLIQNPHDGTAHTQFNPQPLKDYFSYRPANQAPWNQPAIYGYAEKNLSRSEGGNRQPWTLTNSGITSPTLVGSRVALKLASSNTSKAVSKALVYYHRIGDWKEPPNFFNPYWRVKLHPFGITEWALVSGSVLSLDAEAVGQMDVGLVSGQRAMAP